jgi:spore coat polysaccharide biosynthesis predicted glycosyltransferase SpsG
VSIVDVQLIPSRGSRVGRGHESRCRVLADALTQRGAAIVGGGADVVILDRCDDPTDHIELARDDGSAVVLICDRPWPEAPPVDVLVCPGPHADELRFASCRATTRLLGPRYALVDPMFHRVRQASARPLQSLLVSLGGAAQGDLLDRLAAACAPLVETVHVVAPGSLSPREVARLAHRVDGAVVAAGVMSLEMSAAGLPTAVVCVADDQVAAAEGFARLGLAFPLGDLREVPTHHLVDAIEHFVTDADLRDRLVVNSAATFSDPGADLVADVIVDAVRRGHQVAA